MTTQPKRFTLDDAATDLGVSPNTLRYLHQQKRGPKFYKLGRRLFVDREDLDAWVEQQKNGGDAA